ncbi:hypothetical protein OG2516_16971 [Oceanicola granulosus HTCC2516]|uniref:Leucine-binding protein domain-containing protein n=1 Tax=Oceanicola granulosus (strain ATCC BAA-861 / DSM 15982 / KCTC 12143 / HTCC2516) TaxID=314256 RepID=Q2CFP9_OCEGH|nr:penicillin-binding protein activator [Oceanicola granulosus]EAR51433.1 hypothetical protein OG2516_16971 [Oceanicola granulosus HTCC2516]
MFTSLSRPGARLFALLALLFVASCGPVNVGNIVPGSQTGQRIDPDAPVPVALLVPGGSSIAGDELIARDLENAARLAMSDLRGAQIDLRVYDTGATPAGAANAAGTAVAEGAKVILGPLRADAAVAASTAVADVNVLAFTNTSAVAGGNLFILGPTFDNIANRLVSFGSGQGLNRYLVVYGDDAQGVAGRDAVSRAVQRSGGVLLGMESYPLTSQQAVTEAAPRIAAAARSTGAQGVFLTGGVNADLPIIATALPEAGLSPVETRFFGLTRWDAASQALALPGLQGGYFARPDTAAITSFEARYQAAYGDEPHPLAGLAYDGIAAIGALVAQGDTDALTSRSLTQPSGFTGTSGIFRLLPSGLNERALSVATIRNNQVVIVDPAPTSFAAAGL